MHQTLNALYHHQVILPGWTKDVAVKLQDDSKWIHLGLQLGFEMRELKTLSLDENPCLAVFNEHFKKYLDDFRTATKHVMTALENIKQTEALDIIQKDKGFSDIFLISVIVFQL